MGKKVVRRSFALPGQVVEEAVAVAPGELKHNLNRLVIVALQEFVEKKKQEAFEQAMSEMARDRAITGESRDITEEFVHTEGDGL